MSLKKEASWLFLSSCLNAIYVFICYAIITQVESPRVIGELAIINIVISLAFVIQDAGLSGYLIHKQGISRAQQNTLFIISVTLGFLCALLLLLVAYPIGYIYKSVAITQGVLLVSINFLLIGFSNQYQSQFIKNFKNTSLAKIEITSKLPSLFFSIYLIIELRLGLLGYLWGIILASAIKLIFLILKSKKEWHPAFVFDWSITKPAVSFGLYQLGSHTVNQLRTQLDQLVIGAALSIETLGIYSLAKEMVMQPIKLTMPVVSRLILPRFAALQRDIDGFQILYEKSVNVVLIVNTAIYSICALAVWWIVPYFLSKDYDAVLGLYMILLAIGFLRPMGGVFGIAAQAMGRSNVEFRWNIVAGIISILGLAIAYYISSVNGFALILAMTQIFITGYSVMFFSKYLCPFSITKHLTRLICLTVLYLIISFTFFYTQ
ncbi:oligosaccharide flippase family protein [Paraglaciecola hydrolytica]|uniref:Polysaccharide biosynthesis protein C-terminal domain-containing protein n=1 Tax=Paraglaciecola hydrolytica TaxID=1799789 RepID=A0A135ZYU8_9ALTE|nr:oligosaccharide flippase family protein [Paraglaciecola hydrolytica]KXI28156.1 hypothetical protein AX660_17405 [Paraglaciecola hydrolytica]